MILLDAVARCRTKIIVLTVTSILSACASAPVDQIELMPAPDVYGDGLLNPALVKDATEMVTGIITAADIAEIFLAHSEPFMEIEQIETDLRQLIGDKLEGSITSHIQNHERPEDLLSDVSQFSFGEYGKWLENEENWERLNLKVDRGALIDRLTEVNKI
jgi:hypothetical protein